jgi:hypothetical protein
VVLDHVTQCPGIVIESDTPLQPDRLCDRDLDMLDIGRIPDRFEQDIGKAQGEQVLDGFLAEVMIDPVGPVLVEGRGDRIVDLAEVPSGFSRPIRTSLPASPACWSPAMVGSNRLGAVDRKMARPSPALPTLRASAS